jgi:hypothetical protein
MNNCISCGMPMEHPDDHALGDPSREYCKHCARPDGSMQSYDEAVERMSKWMVRTQGLDGQVAKKLAVEMMSSLPAWKGRSHAG